MKTSHERFRRGSEEIRCWYDADEMLIKATLYRDGELVEQTDSRETVERWMKAEAR